MRGLRGRAGTALGGFAALAGAFVWMLGAPCAALAQDEPERVIRVGSKNFTESYVLGEALAQLLEAAGFRVERKLGLGGTLICYRALQAGEIDVYAEYTGTIAQAILELDSQPSTAELRARLERSEGLRMGEPLGFDNTYALALKRSLASERGLETISDLVDHGDLRVAVSHEFLERADGWPGLQRLYGFDWRPKGIEHGLAYRALDEGRIDVTDVYTTDGELQRYQLAVLRDDRGFFPAYLAVPLLRPDLPERALSALASLSGTLDAARMSELNARVVFEGASFASAAREHLEHTGLVASSARAGTAARWEGLRRNTLQHLRLTALALGAATLLGLCTGIAVFRSESLSRTVLYLSGLLQTVPSIALLALMIPLLGIGEVPAVLALFLYSLLPILRNTVTSLRTVDPLLRRVALSMGLSSGESIRHVYLPLAMPGILAGIRTAAVISIGTATLAAFIGAGGLGEPIVTGLALNDPRLILQGAVPAALLAIATELLFEGVERALVPRHLQRAA